MVGWQKGWPAGLRPAIGIGITAGCFGGVVDECLTFLMNVVLVIPNLLLLVLASFIGEASPTVIAPHHRYFTSWAYGACDPCPDPGCGRKSSSSPPKCWGAGLGASSWWEILPNLISIIGVSFIGSIIYAARHRGDPGVPGLGDPTVVSWGIMLYNAPDLQRHSGGRLVESWPLPAIATLGASLAMLNFAIDEIANPQLQALTRVCASWKQLAAPSPPSRPGEDSGARNNPAVGAPALRRLHHRERRRARVNSVSF